MTAQRLPPSLVESLLDTLFSEAAPELRTSCARWCVVSPRFAPFLERYQDKIRKKLRGIADSEGLRDLQAELLTAACLLTERAFTLDYEVYAAAKTRGPDFTLLFKTHSACNVEVKRIRGQAHLGKWADVLCDKVRQLPPSVCNALVIYGEPAERGGAGGALDVGTAMAQLHAAAARKDEALFTRHGPQGARDYLRHVPKLGMVLLRGRSALGGSAPPASWINPRARHPLAPDLRVALTRSLAAL